MPQKSFEDILKDQSAKFSPSPNPQNWEAIANALPPEKKNRRALWIWLSAACITITGLISLLNYSPSKSETTNSAINTTQTKQQLATTNNDTLIKSAVSNTSATITPDIYTPQRTLLNTPVPVIRKAERIPGSRVFVNNDPSETKVPELSTPVPEPEYEIVTVDTTPAKKRDTVILTTLSKKELKKNQSRQLKHFLGIEFAGIGTDTRTKVGNVNTSAFNGPAPIVNQYDYLRNETDKSVLGFQAGITYTLQRKQSSIKTGLFYQQINYTVQVNNTNINSLGSGGRISNFDFNFSDSFVAGEAGIVRNSYGYLRIPLEYWRETFSLSRWHFQYGGGLAANMYLNNQGLNNQASGLYVKSDLADKSVVQAFHLTVNAGVGVGRDFGQRYTWYLNALFARSLSDIEKSVVSTAYQNFGLNAGIRYRLTK